MISADNLILLTMVCGFASVVALWKRRRLRIVIPMIVVLMAWALIYQRVMSETAERNRIYDERSARGENVDEEAAMNDGVGENVAAMILGWFPATVGAFCGIVCVVVLRYLRPTHIDRRPGG